MKEIKIGEEFEVDGQWYKCIARNKCEECGFNNNEKCLRVRAEYPCSAIRRKDRTSVVFIKRDPPKVEPQTRLNKYFVKTKIITPSGLVVTRAIRNASTIETVLKQENVKGFDKIKEMYPSISLVNLKRMQNGDEAKATIAMYEVYRALMDVQIIPLEGIVSGNEDIDKEDTLFVLRALSSGV